MKKFTKQFDKDIVWSEGEIGHPTHTTQTPTHQFELLGLWYPL
jgi:hypothetical protein